MTPSGGRGSYFDSVVRFISRLFAPSQNNIRARIYIYTCDGTYSCENSSCKRIPSRTTLSRESNREIDGLKSNVGRISCRKKRKRRLADRKTFCKIFNQSWKEFSWDHYYLFWYNRLIVGGKNYISPGLRKIFRQQKSLSNRFVESIVRRSCWKNIYIYEVRKRSYESWEKCSLFTRGFSRGGPRRIIKVSSMIEDGKYEREVYR